ncbi:hypothetical protein N7454_002134 [Penicillium verhagenii]|nr:hypothetical protein N7454_002134 [Penicillium verhagenii]
MAGQAIFKSAGLHISLALTARVLPALEYDPHRWAGEHYRLALVHEAGLINNFHFWFPSLTPTHSGGHGRSKSDSG